MLNKDWSGYMTKFGHAKKDETVCVTFTLKHVNEGEIQSFLNSFEKELATNNFKQLFEFPVRWKKLVIDTSDYEKRHFNVEFDEIEFKATLLEISITRKVKNGMDVFEYLLNFAKDVEVEDATAAVTYLNNKEENEDGKKVLVEYPVTLTLSDERSSVDPEFDAF
jgi:hypothetical protein